MLKTYEAVTREIDDIEKAVGEILEQLAPMIAESIGMDVIAVLSCYSEFVDSGVVRALCEELPFEVVGTTTIANSSHCEIGNMMLSLLVITGDNIRFATALSDPVTRNDEMLLRSCYASAFAALGERPVFMMSFFPLINNVSSDYYVDRMSEISMGVPNFGSLAVDHTTGYESAVVLHNGEAYRDRFALLLFAGDISPRFYVENISQERVFPQKDVVTGSQGNLLISVNNMPVVDYLASIGLRKEEDGSISGLNTFPLIVDYGDGTAPVARAVFAMTPEGYAVCGGNIPPGSILSIGHFDTTEILDTTEQTVKTALQTGNHNAALIYSCVGRFYAQGLDHEGEMNRIVKCMRESGVPYLASYSGGELCPVYNSDDKTINRNHNNSIIICMI